MAFQFVFDLNRCTGCQACVVGCWMENRAEQGQNWRQVHTFNAFRHPALPLFHLSLACHHCEDPACLRNCPADAYSKDPVTGAVTVHAERCMGCRYCTWACPHDAPKFNATLGTIEKCTFCPQRLEKGLEPACVARCPVEALGFEERKEGDKHHDIPGFPASEIDPSIRFVPLRREGPPELGMAPEPQAMKGFLGELLRVPEARITLRGEWTLVLFTTVLSVLSAWFIAALIGGPRLPAAVFLGLGLPAMGLSAWHLGRRERAWRAILHLRTSWLSREIFLTGTFLGLGGVFLLVLPEVNGLGWVAAICGFLGLLAIDRIYRVALQAGRWSLHSGQTLLNGHYLLGLLGNLSLLSLGAGLLKLALYLHRKRHFAEKGRPTRPLLSALRLCLGFLGPLLLISWNPLLAALSAVLGDLVDRCEFYDELEIATPQGEIAEALRRRVGSVPSAGSGA
jgi:Fe-S-cluster-containing dehydrogenase component